MTRASVAAIHGHVSTSLAYNPAGILLLVAAVALIVRPAWLSRLRLSTWAVVVAVGTLWVWNIGFNPTFHQLLLR